MKVHLHRYIESAYDDWMNFRAQRDVALNQTECGYIRECITQNPLLVTCKLCLREMNKPNKPTFK